MINEIFVTYFNFQALRLSNKAMGQSSIGQMVNLLSNDVNRFDQFLHYLHHLWIGPLQFILIMYLSWRNIGSATFVGGGLILSNIPIQGLFSKKFSELRSETAKKSDTRIKIMSEIIQGIKVIKMYAWENSFANLVEKARKEEINMIQKTFIYKAMCDTFTFVANESLSNFDHK